MNHCHTWVAKQRHSSEPSATSFDVITIHPIEYSLVTQWNRKFLLVYHWVLSDEWSIKCLEFPRQKLRIEMEYP